MNRMLFSAAVGLKVSMVNIGKRDQKEDQLQPGEGTWTDADTVDTSVMAATSNEDKTRQGLKLYIQTAANNLNENIFPKSQSFPNKSSRKCYQGFLLVPF